ncbi:MAG TPA: CHASE2 domain-containing protein [Leptolyngbyaceae cyanobacterium]
MAKLVVLKFGDGGFDQGFTVTLQIGEESDRPSVELTGKLPPCPEILLYYTRWQSTYLQLGNGYRLDADKIQVTNVSITQDCHELAHILRLRFNNWLQAQEFRTLREKWLEKLQPSDEIRVILQSENSYLQKLPWHAWDLLERYPKAEIALSSPSYELIHKRRAPNPTVNILAIFGNSQGINTQADQAMLQNFTNADVSFLVEPQRKELTDYLWGKNWDILFFAGHSSSQGHDGIGRIYLNKTDSLSISELKYALKQAIERGLQLAIFNSCDGLGLAKELADLNIPQIIVMREPVPDQVAQEFLKYFIQSFASGESLYQAVRHARERLQGLEDIFPCATWLPVICQNPAQIPLTWNELTEPLTQPLINHVPAVEKKCGLKKIALSSLLVTVVVCGLRFLGVLQAAELQAYDQMMRSRPEEGPDPRILIVTIDDEDLATQTDNGKPLKGVSISDKSLNQLLAKLNQYQPKVIGLDVYRDFPAEQSDLVVKLQQTENLIGVCKGSDTTTNIKGTKPPPEIPKERLGFSDFVHDKDNLVRRHLLFMNQETASLCSAPYAFSTQLAFRYLSSLGIESKFTNEQSTKDLQLGNTILHRLSSRAGGYQGIDANGGQILLNYRASAKIAEEVTLKQILSNSIDPNAIKDKIVLIGVTVRKDGPDDFWSTPYGSPFEEQMPGVMVQAHMVSQIISAVLDKRPLLRVWTPGLEIIWIGIWAGLGGFLAWRWRLFSKLALAVGVSSSVLYLSCLSLLVWGFWVPFVPSALSLVSTVTVVSIQNRGQETGDRR